MICRYRVLPLDLPKNKVGSNELTLWADAAERSPKKARSYVNRGVPLHIETEEAKTPFNLGNILVYQGRIEQAIGHYSDASRFKLNDEVARRNNEKLSRLMEKSPFQGPQTDDTETHEKDR